MSWLPHYGSINQLYQTIHIPALASLYISTLHATIDLLVCPLSSIGVGLSPYYAGVMKFSHRDTGVFRIR